MSNALAFATVTTTLKDFLQQAALEMVPGAEVITGRPRADGGDNSAPNNPSIYLYLYQIVPNVAFRTADLPTRRSDGSMMRKPQSAWDLHYLMSFHGSETQLEAQRMLGNVVTRLHAQPLLTRNQIRRIVAASNRSDSETRFLATSNLAEQVESVKFTPLTLNLEELSKVWSVFFQIPYTLSVTYQASVVLIESDDIPQTALPVRDRNLYVVPFRQPVIEKISAQTAAGLPFLENQPVLTGHRLKIEGQQLRGSEKTQIRVGEEDIEIPSADVGNAEIRLTIPEQVKAGVRGLQIVHTMRISTPERDYRAVESNISAFVLRPTLNAIAVDAAATVVTVNVTPAVGAKQRVVLLLNEVSNASGTEAAAYTFSRPSPPEDADDETELSIPIQNVTSGEYLVRLQVDGAESLLSAGADDLYDGPTVTLP